MTEGQHTQEFLDKSDRSTEALQQRRHRYYLAHKAKILEQASRWQETHRERKRELDKDYRDRQRGGPSTRAPRGRDGDRQERHLRAKYMLDMDDRMWMELDAQGRCAICLFDKKLVVDHDHETERIRGLLCHPCNRMLGAYELFREFSPVWAQRFEEYLHFDPRNSAF